MDALQDDGSIAVGRMALPNRQAQPKDEQQEKMCETFVPCLCAVLHALSV